MVYHSTCRYKFFGDCCIEIEPIHRTTHPIDESSPFYSSHQRFPPTSPVMSPEVDGGGWVAVKHCKSRGRVSSHFFLDSRAPLPKHCLLGHGEGEGGTISGHASQDLTVCSCSHSPQRASEFCKNSARSLVALYHEGALPCECHPAGATGHPCSPEGGQCPCRPHVIGRQCTRCQTGFYGFPHCKRKCTFGAAKVISGAGG